MLNPDFREMLSALSEEGAEFLVVGAYALAAHGSPRATGDLDLWVRPTPENAVRVWNALRRFGAPLQDLRAEDLAAAETVFQVGVAPLRIDILTSIDGVLFDEAWPNRLDLDMEGMSVPILGKSDLIRNKRACGRTQDLADVERLEQTE